MRSRLKGAEITLQGTHKKEGQMKEFPVSEHLKQELKDPYFRELYELDLEKLEIVKKIIAYRIKHGLTQKDLAKRSGVSQQFISKIESGEFSNMATLEKILLFIGLTIRVTVVPLQNSVKRAINNRLRSGAIS